MVQVSDADRFFGKQAVALKFVTGAQLDECFALMQKSIDEGAPKAIGDILVDRGFLTDAQIERVQERVRFVELRDQDRAFGKQCVKQGWLTLRQLDTALEIQHKTFRRKRHIRSLGEIVVQEEMLAPEIKEKVVAVFGSGGASALPPAPPPAPAEASEPPAEPTRDAVPDPPPSTGADAVIPVAVLDRIATDAPVDLADRRTELGVAPAEPETGAEPLGPARKGCPLCKTLVLVGLSACPSCGGLFCPHCGAASPARLPVCVGCGHAFEPAASVTIPASMEMWLEPPWSHVLAVGLCLALGALIYLSSGTPARPREDPLFDQMRTSRDPTPPPEPRNVDPSLAAESEAAAPTPEPVTPKPPAAYEGTVITIDGAVLPGRIVEWRERVVVTTRWGSLTVARKEIRELRQGTGPASTDASGKTPETGAASFVAPEPTVPRIPDQAPTETPAPTVAVPGEEVPSIPATATSAASHAQGVSHAPGGVFEPEPPEPEEGLPPLPAIDDLMLVKLEDGREMSGQVTRVGETVEIRMKLGTTRLPLDQVAEIVVSPDQEYARQAQAAEPQGASGHFDLANRMRAEGRRNWARREYLLTLRADPGHAGAHRALGHFELGGVWRSATRVLRCAEALFAAARLEEAEAALSALLAAATDTAAPDVPVTPLDLKLRSAELLVRCQLRANRIPAARETCSRMEDWATPAQRPRVRVLDQVVRACSPEGMIDVRSDEVALNLLEEHAGALELQPGPQPLWDARVLDIVIRREAGAIVARVKELIAKGGRGASRDADEALQCFENAESLCADANEIYPGFARGYQLEAVRLQVPLLFQKAETYMQKADASHPTKFAYLYDEKTKRMVPESFKEFVAHQREWNGYTERCRAVVDRAVKIAERYPQEMQERLDALRELQKYLDETIPRARKELDAIRNANR